MKTYCEDLIELLGLLEDQVYIDSCNNVYQHEYAEGLADAYSNIQEILKKGEVSITLAKIKNEVYQPKESQEKQCLEKPFVEETCS